MKTLSRIIFLLGSALLASFLLSNCGGNASTTTPASSPTSTPTPTPTQASSTFAFLQDNDPKNQSPIIPAVRTHEARPQASNTVNIAAGTVDAYVMEAASTANSSTVTKLNSRSGEYNGIQLSPDKTRVVFTADDITGYSQIFVAVVGNFDNPTQLTSNQTVDHFLATFSPDGNTILSSVFNRSADLWTISMLPAVAGGTETVITNPSTLQPTPSFTPDGRKIVFAGVGIDGGLFIMNLDGSGRTQLTNLNSNVNQEDFFPSVSPDGTKIAFERGVFNLANDSWTYNIYVVGIGGESAANAATQLTTDGYSWGSMYAGDSIAFLSPKNNLATTRGDDIYMMSPDGSNVVQLTNKGLESFLTWNGAE